MRLASRTTTLAVGLVVILALVLSMYLALTASTGLPGQQFRTATASFADVGGLREGDDVRSASVRIGQVRSIRYEDGRAVVGMQFETDQQIYRDASAAVVARSALGQNFVLLTPGKQEAGLLPEGAELQASRVSSPVNLDTVLSVLDSRTRAATSSTLREVGSGLAGRSQDLADALSSAPDLLRDLGQVATELSRPETGLATYLQTSRRFASRFDGRTEHVGRLIAQMGDTVAALGVDDGAPLGQTIEQAPDVLRKTRTAMANLRTPLTDLDASMSSLRPGALALGRATPDLRGTLREAVGPLQRVPGVARSAQPALSSLSNLMIDARPLSDRLVKTFDSLSEPSSVLAPYSAEIARWFVYWNSANSGGDENGNALRINLLANTESGSGGLPVADPLVRRNPYPAPGQASRDRATTGTR